MTVRNIAIALAIGASAVSAAHAGPAAGNGFVFVGGEIGYVERFAEGQISRDQVRQELAQFKRNPLTADGGRIVGGEVGYEPATHAYALRNGNLECIDNIAHNARPDAIKTPAEQERFRQLYPA